MMAVEVLGIGPVLDGFEFIASQRSAPGDGQVLPFQKATAEDIAGPFD